MILFVIANNDIYCHFEKEFLKFARLSDSFMNYTIYVNGYHRRIVLVKIDTMEVDWEQILSKYCDNKFSFLAIFGDATTYKLIESVLNKLYLFFITISKSKEEGNRVYESNSSIQKVSGNLSTPNSMHNMSNIAIMVCLRSHIIDDYRKFLTNSEDSPFFQDSMLGRLVMQGRNLCSKYSAKMIEPYLEDILEKNAISPIHEFQVLDSIKYLEETLYYRTNCSRNRYSSINTIKILMCCMCGDNYPLEIVIGVLLYGRKYEYSNRRETLYFEFKIGEDSLLEAYCVLMEEIKTINSIPENLHSELSLSTDYENTYATFKIQFDKKKHPSLFLNTSEENDKSKNFKSTIEWSDNPSFGSTPQQRISEKDERENFASTEALNEISRTTFHKESAKQKISNIFNNKYLTLKKSKFTHFEKDKFCQKTKDFLTDAKLSIEMQPSKDNSTGTRKKLLVSNQFRSISTIGMKKRQSQTSHQQKMLEWEKNISKSSKYNYFGKSIMNIVCVNNIPLFVIQCVKNIEENGLDVEGLYRKNGSKQDIESLHYPNPLSLKIKLMKLLRLQAIILSLPERVKETLAYIMHHFSRIAMLSEKNKMDSSNIAICVWPSLIKYKIAFDTPNIKHGNT
ncbi:hypothetical protein MXB_3527, partial [Myxobolus squamalis]